MLSTGITLPIAKEKTRLDETLMLSVEKALAIERKHVQESDRWESGIDAWLARLEVTRLEGT